MKCYIKELQEENKRLKNKLEEFGTRFYCIGHPLNDNVLKFNNEQLVYLARFADEIKDSISEVRG